MPPTLEAAAVTDGYRLQLFELREAIAAHVATRFGELELDASSAELELQVLGWAHEAAQLTTPAQAQAVTLTRGYLTAYLEAAGVDEALPDVEGRALGVIGRAKALDEVYASAGWAMLWRLQGAAGGEAVRATATAYGQAFAVRTARTAVLEPARGALADLVAAGRRFTGWRRVTASRSCDECHRHAGQVYGDRHAFYAHPSCHCTAEPVLRDVPERFTRALPQVVATTV